MFIDRQKSKNQKSSNKKLSQKLDSFYLKKIFIRTYFKFLIISIKYKKDPTYYQLILVT